MSPTFNFLHSICTVFGFKFLPPQTKSLYWCDKKYNNLIWAPLTKCPHSVCKLNFYHCRKMTQNYNLNPYNTSFFKVLNLLCCFHLVSMLTSIIQIFLGSWMIYPWESSTIIMSSFFMNHVKSIFIDSFVSYMEPDLLLHVFFFWFCLFYLMACYERHWNDFIAGNFPKYQF